MGIEPTSTAWKAVIIAIIRRPQDLLLKLFGRGAEIRTRTTCSQSKRAAVTLRPVTPNKLLYITLFSFGQFNVILPEWAKEFLF